jgi:hypothetical protein
MIQPGQRSAAALAVVTPARTPPPPPAGLGAAGRALWLRITNKHPLDGGAESVALEQACKALDRAGELAELLEREGLTTTTARGGTKAHPAVAGELAARIFVARIVLRLARGDGHGPSRAAMRQGAGHGIAWWDLPEEGPAA